MKPTIAVLLAVTVFCHAAPKERETGNWDELSQSRIHSIDDFPPWVDWRKEGVISPVQNRPRNISGSPLIVMETVQAHNARQYGTLQNLSLPQVVDCLGQGQVVNSFQVIADIGGLCLQTDYPAQRNQCEGGECKVAAPVELAERTHNELEMMNAILFQPLMAFVDGSLPSFKSYIGGIYDEPGCNPNVTTNALQVVGYVTVPEGKSFWICKNNWGTDWGEGGYIRIVKGVNMCGIETWGQYPR